MQISEKVQLLIEVIEAEIPEKCKNVIRVCDPEDLFDVIEQCKICGRCV